MATNSATQEQNKNKGKINPVYNACKLSNFQNVLQVVDNWPYKKCCFAYIALKEIFQQLRSDTKLTQFVFLLFGRHHQLCDVQELYNRI